MNWQLPSAFSKGSKLLSPPKLDEKIAAKPTIQKHRLQGEVAVIETDPFGFITSWSVKAEKIYGYGAGDITGNHIAVLYPVNDLALGKPAADLRAAEHRQNPYFSFGWQKRANGQEFWTYSESKVIRGANNEVLGFRKYVVETPTLIYD